MTIAELHANEELRLHEFPVAREKVFLAHAGVCPIPRRVSEAIRSYAAECVRGDQETLLPSFQIRKTRELAARLLGARMDEISFVGPTSLALSLVAGGLRLRENDNILAYFDDYPSNVYPWMALAERGVKVRFLKVREYGRIDPEEIMAQVDERTRLVALASCHFVAGYRPDLEAIGQFLRGRGILFCVDAIQTVGAFPTDVGQIDFLAADAHKWMLGPCAAGLLFVRKSCQEALRPAVYGWHNVECPGFIAQETMKLPQDGRRYEAGTENLLGLAGLHAAMELILEVGVENIGRELLRKRGWIVPALRGKGYEVLHAETPALNSSGIISFHKPGLDLAELHRKLERAGIILSLRFDRGGKSYLRISAHFYNTDAELRRVLEAI
jgi:cysteine desulfurase/selenocysteine lyase